MVIGWDGCWWHDESVQALTQSSGNNITLLHSYILKMSCSNDTLCLISNDNTHWSSCSIHFYFRRYCKRIVLDLIMKLEQKKLRHWNRFYTFKFHLPFYTVVDHEDILMNTFKYFDFQEKKVETCDNSLSQIHFNIIQLHFIHTKEEDWFQK